MDSRNAGPADLKDKPKPLSDEVVIYNPHTDERPPTPPSISIVDIQPQFVHTLNGEDGSIPRVVSSGQLSTEAIAKRLRLPMVPSVSSFAGGGLVGTQLGRKHDRESPNERHTGDAVVVEGDSGTPKAQPTVQPEKCPSPKGLSTVSLNDDKKPESGCCPAKCNVM